MKKCNTISIELLCEVMKIDISTVKNIKDGEHNDIWIFHPQVTAINIYELANKCKTKAYELGYRIESNPTNSKIYDKDGNLRETCYNTNFYNPTIFDPMLDILVFEWILDNKASK